MSLTFGTICNIPGGCPYVLHPRAPAPSASSSAYPPLLNVNFADPAILINGDTTYLYSTTSDQPTINVPMASKSSSSDDVSIIKNPDGSIKDAMPTAPAWAPHDKPEFWAPDVVQLPSGEFILYFAAASSQDSSKHCVGAAKSPFSPEGPFTSLDSDTPFICDLPSGGSIDPAGFIDDATGKMYVVTKTDGNSLGGGGTCGNANGAHKTPLIAQEVDPKDGYTKIGDPVTLLDRTDDDGPYIEAPSIARTGDGQYVLFFSSECYNGPNYDVKYATASSITGPYTRGPSPLIKPGDFGLMAPGGASVTRDAKRIVFHSDAKYSDATVRWVHTAEIDVSGGKVSLVQAGQSGELRRRERAFVA